MARVAIILGEMFEDSEFRVPYDRLRGAGHEVIVLGSGTATQKHLEGYRHQEKVAPARSIREVTARDFDALVIPGGYSPDHLRTDPLMVDFTRQMVDAGKPVAAVCHAGSMLVEADVVDERTVTSWPSIKTDLLNAGAHWVDQEVVEDGNLITSRRPGDLAAFSDAILRQLEGRIPERISPYAHEGEPSIH
ncbi:MAG TPA: type 1 glutamine amidotransferase domain-containing protein [Polyangia bacterium]|jgi:protease I|nr:type 1 glutamine amidotransferase domain-containing protein [Polyangia bacterium]